MTLEGLGLETDCYQVQGTKFEVEKRYQILEPVSQGAYGVVCSADDRITGNKVAVKKIEGVFEHVTITKRTLRELRILRHLQHENLMQILNVFIPGAKGDFEEIYVVSELMETDLASTLRSSQALSDDHCQFFLYQILRGMKYIHSAQVIHRDLKPRNLLVNSNCDLKICDFGLARVRFSDMDWISPMTEYVCTRWYRAPEVLCSWTDYSESIDIWSIGCVLAELHMRQPLFPGHNTQHQLDLIIGILGSPDAEELDKISNEKCRRFIKALPKKSARVIREVTKGHLSEEAVDLMERMLRWDPTMRVNVFEAIQHPYLEKLHCPEDEPVRAPLDTTEFEYERRKITAAVLREEMFRESLMYHPELLEQLSREERAKELGVHDLTKFRLLVMGDAPSSDSDDEEKP